MFSTKGDKAFSVRWMHVLNIAGDWSHQIPNGDRLAVTATVQVGFEPKEGDSWQEPDYP
jgi:hypothetical protein